MCGGVFEVYGCVGVGVNKKEVKMNETREGRYPVGDQTADT